MATEVCVIDYSNQQQARDLCALLDDYAKDPMGGGEPLPDSVKANLAAELANFPTAFSVICYIDGKPAGLVNCFEGFSTFQCRPLINIHDMAVVVEYRGKNISQMMLDKVEEIAREKGCCKITLEVLEGNRVARNAYQKFGFDGYELDPDVGKALFWQKKL